MSKPISYLGHVQGNAIGKYEININTKLVNNLWYADDNILITDEHHELKTH